MSVLRLNTHEEEYIKLLYPIEPWESDPLRLFRSRLPHLDWSDRCWLDSALVRRRHLESCVMALTPPKHSASRSSEEWYASFWYRMNFLYQFISHIRGVGPEPLPGGQSIRKQVIFPLGARTSV